MMMKMISWMTEYEKGLISANMEKKTQLMCSLRIFDLGKLERNR